MNFYPRYVGDFARDTARLSLVEVGIYDRLLDDYYAQERPLPADLDAACSVARARTPSERSAVQRVLEKFFPIDAADGLRHNKRADAEIAKGRDRIQKARANGKHGGRPPKPPRTPPPKPSGFPPDNPAGSGAKPSGLTPQILQTTTTVGGGPRARAGENPAGSGNADLPAAVRLAVAANHGLTETHGELLHPLLSGHTTAVDLARWAEGLADDGVTWAEAAIYTAAKGLRMPPKTLGYFRPILERLWQERQATADLAATPAPTLADTGTHGRAPRPARNQRNLEVLANWRPDGDQ